MSVKNKHGELYVSYIKTPRRYSLNNEALPGVIHNQVQSDLVNLGSYLLSLEADGRLKVSAQVLYDDMCEYIHTKLDENLINPVFDFKKKQKTEDTVEVLSEVEEEINNLPKTKQMYLNPKNGKMVSYQRAKVLGLIKS